MATKQQELESLCYLETMFQEYGFEDGFRDGEKSGELEGRLFGCEKGFELGREIGFYSGCIQVWAQLAEQHGEKISPKVVKHIETLQRMIDEFPKDNCPNTDLFALRDKMKMKMKVITSLLGIQQKYNEGEVSKMSY
ncbi:uncharacterized protein BYT42DRAFT_610966 [Radiomyces spectabilis]|uniref:uncharacterized protein n=1 Tax=Radiomyces spectabilis TaxID=64574 RepID=UPI00221F0567|nr:uncharacterized protein BYT42DRAFT_610966 [Radiomyces spectabilis]KAI8391775.1 hypothetical protein BYT42DRAFT_610966 [Radiomyces spectabilis]